MIQEGKTALIIASEYSHLPVVQYLAQQSADINAQDEVSNHNNNY